MDDIKKAVSYQFIPIDRFATCLADNLSLDEICKKYTKNDLNKSSCYRLDKFEFHLKNHFALNLRDYCIEYLYYDWPKCPVSQEWLGYRVVGNGIKISMFKQGAVRKEYVPALDAAYKRFSEERKGENNPMFGKEGWSKGLTKENCKSLKSNSEKQKLRTTSEETKKKQRLARKNSNKKARHTTPHSEASKEKLRKSTARLWAEGVFDRTTSIHIKVRDFLQTLNLLEKPVEEFQVKYFSMDFAFPNHKIAIECQGSYYHIDPRIYPNGPINAMQRRNFGRDKAKRKVCCDQEGWIIIELWEPEINDGTFKDILQNKLLEYTLIDDL